MSRIIEDYYAKAKVMPLLLKRKMTKLSRHSDIAKESSNTGLLKNNTKIEIALLLKDIQQKGYLNYQSF